MKNLVTICVALLLLAIPSMATRVQQGEDNTADLPSSADFLWKYDIIPNTGDHLALSTNDVFVGIDKGGVLGSRRDKMSLLLWDQEGGTLQGLEMARTELRSRASTAATAAATGNKQAKEQQLLQQDEDDAPLPKELFRVPLTTADSSGLLYACTLHDVWFINGPYNNPKEQIIQGMFALNATSGKVLWRSSEFRVLGCTNREDSGERGIVAVGNSSAVSSSSPRGVFGVEYNTGKVVWSYPDVAFTFLDAPYAGVVMAQGNNAAPTATIVGIRVKDGAVLYNTSAKAYNLYLESPSETTNSNVALVFANSTESAASYQQVSALGISIQSNAVLWEQRGIPQHNLVPPAAMWETYPQYDGYGRSILPVNFTDPAGQYTASYVALDMKNGGELLFGKGRRGVTLSPLPSGVNQVMWECSTSSHALFSATGANGTISSFYIVSYNTGEFSVYENISSSAMIVVAGESFVFATPTKNATETLLQAVSPLRSKALYTLHVAEHCPSLNFLYATYFPQTAADAFQNSAAFYYTCESRLYAYRIGHHEYDHGAN